MAEELVEDAQVVAEDGQDPPALSPVYPNEVVAPALPDALIITVERAEDGSVGVALQVSGDVRLTEIASLLRLAVAKWDASLE